jgi:hypothetical protein
MLFQATVELSGKTATGIEVPERVVGALGESKRPAVTVTIKGYSYRSTVARMGGRFLVGVSAENRAGAGVVAGDRVEAEVILDQAPREVGLPPDLAAALDAAPEARRTYEACAPSHKKEWVRWIEEAKKPETRTSRVTKAVLLLEEGKRTH